jgi:hypothetical protein
MSDNGFERQYFTRQQLEQLWNQSVEITTIEEAVNQLDSLLDQMLIESLEKDGSKPALLLSGGVDSSILLAKMVQHGAKPFCLTIGTEDSQDVIYAESVSNFYQVPWKMIELSDSKVMEGIMSSFKDLPEASGMQNTLSYLMINACLENASDSTSLFTESALDFLAQGMIVSDLDPDNFYKSFWEQSWPSIERCFVTPDNVAVFDVVSRKHKIPVKAPWEDPRLILLIKKFSPELFFSDNRDKALVRILAEKLGVPEMNVNRTKTPFQSSSGSHASIHHLMLSQAAELLSDHHANYDPASDSMLAERFWLRLLGEQYKNNLIK